MKRIITFAFLFFIIVVNFNLLKGVYEDNQKLQTVNKQAQAVTNLQKTNADFKKKLSEVASPFFVEKEARNRLDYGKNGESTIIVGGDLNLAQNSTNQVKDNPQKWLELLRNQH